jgi:hypothetical protein
MLEDLLDASLQSIEAYVRRDELQARAHYRLALCELGLSIGLRALVPLRGLIEGRLAALEAPQAVDSLIAGLLRYMPLADKVLAFWRKRERQETERWKAHQEINSVMLGTCLVPDGNQRI